MSAPAQLRFSGLRWVPRRVRLPAWRPRWRRADRRDPILGSRVGRRVGWMVALFPFLIASIVGYSARTTSKVANAIVVINVAARQRALAERYILDVLLKIDGQQADPAEDAVALSDTATALLEGGDVLALQGADQTIHIDRASSDRRVIVKLQQERKLIDQLIDSGAALLEVPTTEPDYADRLLQLRVLGAQVFSVTNDAVGELTRQEQTAVRRLVLVEVGLGLAGALVALAAAVRLRRAGARQAAQFHSLITNSSDVITVLDSGGTILYQSPAIERLLGHGPDELVGRPMEELIHPDDAAAAAGLLRDRNGSGDLRSTVECRMLHADGSWRNVETAVAALPPTSRFRGLVLNSRDVTERTTVAEMLRRTQEARVVELQKTAAQLREIDEMKNAFLSAVSHELRTPLTSVLGYGVTLERAESGEVTLTTRDRQVFLSRLVGSARKLDRLLEELLDLDRLSRGVVQARREAVELGAFVRRVVEEGEFGRDRPIHVETHPMVLPVDGPKVERILENLLANAMKYSPPRSPIWVRLERVPEGALLAVEDAGSGLVAQDREVIFEPFRQGSNRNIHAPGVGIGLSLVAKFAELHGGRAWVEDRPGGGSSFRVLLRDPTAPEPNGPRS